MKINYEVYEVYFTNQDGRRDHVYYPTEKEAVDFANKFLYAWGHRDENMKVVKVIKEEINFEKI